MPSIYIYVLLDPRTGDVRYVGKTNNPKRRRLDHRCPSTSPKGLRRRAWVMELHALGLRPELKVIEECTDENWPARERFWIARYGGIRKLLNARLGGCKEPPRLKETYDAIGEKLRGRKRTPETVAKMLAAWQRRKASGWKHSENTKEKLRQATRNQFCDPLTRKNHEQAMNRWSENLTEEDRAILGRNARMATSRFLPHPEQWDTMSAEEKQRRIDQKDVKWMKYLTLEQREQVLEIRAVRWHKGQTDALKRVWEERRQGLRPMFIARGKQVAAKA